jgi:hypothetical protein
MNRDKKSDFVDQYKVIKSSLPPGGAGQNVPALI